MVSILGFQWPDILAHDTQHYMASMVAMVLGLTVFVTYYFFSRIESQARGVNPLPWNMPWWYFVVGGILMAFTFSAIACVLSVAVRPREIHVTKE